MQSCRSSRNFASCPPARSLTVTRRSDYRCSLQRNAWQYGGEGGFSRPTITRTDAHAAPVVRDLVAPEQNWLSQLANLASLCRSTVEIDGYTKEIVNVPYPELPGRIAKQLIRLLLGLEAIGVGCPYKYELVRRVALDCIPPLRLKVLRQLASNGRMPTHALAGNLKLPLSSTWRVLQPLKVHGVIVAQSETDGEWDDSDSTCKRGAPPAIWSLSAESNRLWEASRNIGRMLE